MASFTPKIPTNYRSEEKMYMKRGNLFEVEIAIDSSMAFEERTKSRGLYGTAKDASLHLPTTRRLPLHGRRRLQSLGPLRPSSD